MDIQLSQRESATERGWKLFQKALGIAIILIVSLFGDVMYIELMSARFPQDMFLLTISYVGGFTTFLAMAFLLAGKLVAFTPGKQMVVAWLVFITEIVTVSCNFILIYQGIQNVTGLLSVWLFLAPATPVWNMIGVALLLFLDEGQLRRHKVLELEQEKHDVEQQTAHAMVFAALDAKQHMVSYVNNSLAGAVNTAVIQQIIDETAQDMVRNIASDLSGRSYALPEETHVQHGKVQTIREAEQPPFFEHPRDA